MGRRLPRWTALVAATAAAALAVWLGAYWRVLRVHYLSAQLERAETFTEAREILETIAADAAREEVSRPFVAKLGPGQPRLTFWFFTYCLWKPEDATREEEMFGSKHLAPLMPLVERFAVRAGEDDRLLGMWAQYLYWRREYNLWDQFDYWVSPPQQGLVSTLFGALIGASIPKISIKEWVEEFARGHPEQFRTFYYLTLLAQSGEAWLAGVERITRIPQVPRQVDPEPLKTVGLDDGEGVLKPWLRENWQRLRFDSDLGRCVRLREGSASDPRPFKERGYPRSPVPWRGWAGAVPVVPKLVPLGGG